MKAYISIHEGNYKYNFITFSAMCQEKNWTRTNRARKQAFTGICARRLFQAVCLVYNNDISFISPAN